MPQNTYSQEQTEERRIDKRKKTFETKIKMMMEADITKSTVTELRPLASQLVRAIYFPTDGKHAFHFIAILKYYNVPVVVHVCAYMYVCIIDTFRFTWKLFDANEAFKYK